MAKVRSVLNLSGTLLGMTFVDSKAYGAHVRTKRGTHTPISLNQGMKESAAVQTQVNLMAKLIFAAVNDFIPGFKDGKLWSRLLSVFRQQKKAGKDFSYTDFSSMEMRLDYPTSKHGYFHLTKDERQGVMLHYQLAKGACYRIRILRIATDDTLLQAYPYETLTVDLKEGMLMGEMLVDFTVLPDNTHTLYVLHCQQLTNGEPLGLLKSNGVKFL